MAVKSPITIHLLTMGSSPWKYAKQKNIDYNQLIQVINGHKTTKHIIAQLKKDNLWHLMNKHFPEESANG